MNNILLKDYLIEITKGTTPTTIGGEFIESGVNFVKAECLNTGRIIDKSSLSYISPEIHKKLNRSILQEDDLLFSIAGHLGKMAIVRKEDLPANTNQAVAILRIDQKKGDVNFLYYYLNSTQISNYIRKQCAQSVQPNLNLAQVGQLPIIVYSLPTQKSIAKVLSDLDAKIELNNKINRELEAMAKTLYDYWFVQFDFPTPPSSTSGIVGKPYKSSGGKMVYNEALKREIPEGWEVKELSQIANITMGQSPSGSSYNNDGVGEIFYQGSTDFGWRYPSVRQYTTEPSRMAKSGDILLSVRAPVGTLNIADNDCCIGRGLAALNSKSGYDSYLYYVMEYFKQIFDHRNKAGTTFGSITKDDLFSLKLVYPKESLLVNYNQIVSKYNQIILNNHKQNQQLSSLRDWLLPMLMNGQVASRASATAE